MKQTYLWALSMLFCTSLCAQQQSLPAKEVLFTENKGQLTDQYGQPLKDVYFTTNISGMQLSIAKQGLHYQWQQQNADSKTVKTYRVDTKLLNSSSPTRISTENEAPDLNNYYSAYYPDGIIGVKKYGKVTLQNVYNNIDWVFYTNNGDVEYDFIVRPGGNPNDIALSFEGATDLSISETGSLLITSPLGSCEQQAPASWQNGKKLTSKFVLEGNILRLQVDNYNPDLALNIDPIIKVWGTYYGGGGDEVVTDVKTDNSGNVYMVGYTNSVDVLTSGAHQNTSNGDEDGFIVKYNAAGNVLWSTYYGGEAADQIIGCATDAAGNIFVSGTTLSATGIAINGYKNSINSSSVNPIQKDAFLVKLNASGIRQWGTYLGNIIYKYDDFSGFTDTLETTDHGYTCATDANGNVFVSGITFWSTDYYCYDVNGTQYECPHVFIGTPGSYQPDPPYTTTSGPFPFVVKFNNAGTRLWGSFYGSLDYSATYVPLQCTTDGAGDVYLASTIDQWYVGPTLAQSGHQSAAGGMRDIWLAKLNATGTARLWGTYYGGLKDDIVTGLCTDSIGNVFISGHTKSSNTNNVIATPGAHGTGLLNANGGSAFLAKFNSAGTRQWGTYYGDVAQAYGGTCAADNQGNVFTTVRSQFVSGNSVGMVGYCGNTTSPVNGVAIQKFDATGDRVWGEAYKSETYARSVACAVSKNGKSIYLGDTYTYNANVPLNAAQSTVGGGYDAYLLCYTDSMLYDTICGYVYDDQNGNGVQDAGEGYLSNINVYITAPQGVETFNAYTDANGYYQLVRKKWGTSGSCSTPLFVSKPFGTTVSMPVSGSYAVSVLGLPTCSYNFGISPAITVSGRVYYDNNQNGTYNSATEYGISIQSVSFNGQYQAFTESTGLYSTMLPVGTYTETFDKLDAYSTSTSMPANYTINGPNAGATFTDKNFGAYFTPSFVDSRVKMWQSGIPPVVGQSWSWVVNVSNVGTISSTDTIVFHYDPLLVYTGTSIGVTVDLVAHTLTYITGGIVPARFQNVGFNFTVPSGVPAGTVLHNWVFVNPASQPDVNLADNTVHSYNTVLSSYDPNNKLAETNTGDPSVHTAPAASNGDDLIQYTINFQNTGTYQAFNVVVIDTLPVNLDETSVRFISSRHTCTVSRAGRVLNFKFSGINLPDSASNPTGSQGYIVFEVKPKQGVSQGDSIVNNAAIYFDYNTPVITAKNIINISNGGPCAILLTRHINDTVCSFNQPYTFYSHNITAPGVYNSDTLTSASGCDSIVVLHLAYIPNTASITRTLLLPCSSQSLLVALSTGEAPYTYSWTGNVNNDTLQVTTAGTYSVTVTDINACSAMAAYTVASPPVIQIDSIAEEQRLCNTVLLRVHIGNATLYNYNWSAGLSGDSLLAVAGNSYAVTVSDALGCSATASHMVANVPDNLTASISSILLSVCSNNYILLAEPGSGTAPYAYNWNGGVNNDTLTISTAGTYSLTITDANGCSTTTSQMIVPALSALDVDVSVISLEPCTNSHLLVAVPGNGLAPYIYNWTGSISNDTLFVNTAGTYNVTVTDANGCSASFSEIITPALGSLQVEVSTVLLEACTDRSLLIAISQTGLPPFAYSWTGGLSNDTIAVNTAGTYTVIVTDANGCTDTASKVVLPAQNITAIVTANGNILSTGSFASYQWLRNNIAINNATMQTYTAQSNGSYKVAVSDTNNCKDTSDAYMVIGIGINEASIETIQLYPNPTTGILNIETDGLGAYELEITNAIGQCVFIQHNIASQKYSVNISGFSPGIYFARIQAGKANKIQRFVLAK